ncbi:dihydrofolate reductase [Maribacter sp. 2304DJ31-5]|uniref:dihydrofolate reductase n=1 Tax=Maribacter sp. 2304DJ31-5 TaxID=3386273 RepID=UPI0039BD1D09
MKNLDKKNYKGSITIIAAASENDALGKDNDLVWHLPDDFMRFKKITMGHKIIMGRKTFESLPKPLPDRTHIIITRSKKYVVEFDDCIVVHSLKKALQLAEGEDAFIIGGGEIYRQSEKFADKIELTRVHAHLEADTFFPKINNENWQLVQETFHPKDDRHQYAFTYLTYVRPQID